MSLTATLANGHPTGWSFAFTAWLWLAATAATPAAAGEALELAWHECRTGSGLASETFGCGDNQISFDLVLAFRAGHDVTEVIGVEAVLDVQHSSSVLPDWWQMGSSGCRSKTLAGVGGFADLTDCVDPWRGAGTAALQGFDIGQPRGGAGQVRIRAVAGVLPKNAVTIDADTVYYALRLRLMTAKSGGPGSCPGCIEPACLVLNGITLRRLAGPDVVLVTPAAPGSNRATWNGGTAAACDPVPVRRGAWRAVKALYR